MQNSIGSCIEEQNFMRTLADMKNSVCINIQNTIRFHTDFLNSVRSHIDLTISSLSVSHTSPNDGSEQFCPGVITHT